MPRRGADRRQCFTGWTQGLRPGRSPRGHGERSADRGLQVGPVPPRRIEDIPQSHVGQLALYREVLRTLYPNHRVRAALVWTAGPALTEFRRAPCRNVKALRRVKTPPRERALTSGLHTFGGIQGSPPPERAKSLKSRGAPWASQRFPIPISRPRCSKRRAGRGRLLGRVVRPVPEIAPALEEIAGSMNGKVKIVKLNVDEKPGPATSTESRRSRR